MSDAAFLKMLGTDGKKWSEEFCDEFGITGAKESIVHGWFANAIEAGRLAGYRAEKTLAYSDVYEIIMYIKKSWKPELDVALAHTLLDHALFMQLLKNAVENALNKPQKQYVDERLEISAEVVDMFRIQCCGAYGEHKTPYNPSLHSLMMTHGIVDRDGFVNWTAFTSFLERVVHTLMGN